MASLLYEGLFRLDQTFTPQPLLCASYTYDSETLTYKLTLRDGVVFSDGSPLTAADVKTTLNAARSSARYARRLSDVKSISAGDGTVTLTLNRPNTGLPALLDIPILKSGTEKHSVPLGTGPYLYDESSESCLIASQNWWRHLSQPVDGSPSPVQRTESALPLFFPGEQLTWQISPHGPCCRFRQRQLR